MPNGINDKTSQGISPAFGPSSNFHPSKNIWSNPISNNRDVPGSRGSDETSPSGFDSLPNTTDTTPWATANPWAVAEQTTTRPTSGSTSPKRTRDDRQVLPMSNGTSAFFDPTPTNGVAAIRNGYPRKLMMDDDKESPMAPFGSSYPSTYNYDQDANAAFRRDKRGAQEQSYLGVGPNGAIGAFAPQSRESSIPPSRQSHHSVQDVFGLSDRHAPNGISQPVPLSAQRPPTAAAFAAANSRVYNFNSGNRQDDELTERFRKSLKLAETPANTGLALPTPASAMYPGVISQQPLSQLNSAPGTWADGGIDGLGRDAYADPLPSHFGAASKRNSTDRVSHISAGPCNVPNNPRNSAAGADVWTTSRPPSYDAKTVTADMDRRVLHPYIPSPQMHQYYQTPPQFFPSFPPQYGPPYDPYALAGYARPPMPFPAYGASPVSPYLSGPGASPRQQQREQDPARGMRSMLLEEFKGLKNHSRFALKEIYGHVVEFSGDQHGSRFIQSKLETANSDEKEVLFNEIGPNAVQLMKDVFGNYVIQKFFAHGNQIQKKVLAGHMKGKMIDLSLQMYSCRVVQKALEHVLVEQQAEMAKELEHDVLSVIKDQNGNHVVQKIIELVPRQYIGFIVDSMRGQASQLASHMYGCRVVQRLLEHGSEQDKSDLLGELHAAAQFLIPDQYGNYVAQHIIQLGKTEDQSRMIQLVASQLLTLSKHKFASNVVEKCIQHGSDEERKTILDMITDKGSDPSGPLYAMMKDQYGNYVIQKLYLQLQGDERAAFLELLLPLINLAKKANSTRQITALERLIYGPPSRNDGAPQPSKNTLSEQATLQVDVNSAAPTPSLTNGLNSPLSTSPTSLSAGATGDVQSASSQALGDRKIQSASPDVRVHEM